MGTYPWHGRKRRHLPSLTVGILGLVLAGPAAAQSPRGSGSSGAQASGGLTAFRSDAELRRYLVRHQVGGGRATLGVLGDGDQDIVVTGAAVQPSITNNQEAGVDEGGIVKLSGNHLVILRRGRLFTISLAGGAIRPVDSINAFPPGVSGEDDWYDEMLVSGDRVVVIGYSYARGGTEINRFHLDAAGRLRFEDAWHLTSDDYYSTRNYASRLIGDRLVFYTPLPLRGRGDPLDLLPGLRKWRPGQGRDVGFRRIAPARRIYIAPSVRRDEDASVDTLHTVTRCNLAAPELDCAATGVLGSRSRTFYVSRGAVYLWVSDWTSRDRRPGEADAFIYRLPFDDEAPSALGAAAGGAPVDQFSFREDGRDGMLNVLLREDAGGDAMGGPEVTAGRVGLLRVPIRAFGDGSRPAARSFYRRLPGPGTDEWSFRNRFVGDHVLYGVGESDDDQHSPVYVAPVRGGPVAQLQLGHVVDRIDIIGGDAVVIGSAADDSLHLTAIALPRRGAPVRGDTFVLPASSEGESRSHAFFFRPLSPDGASGILGLPVSRELADTADDRLFGQASAMLFLRRDAGRFAAAGELDSHPDEAVDDGCEASCTDWYGNARPIFIGERVFALLGYELVEGRLAGGRIREIGRVDFAPPARHRRPD